MNRFLAGLAAAAILMLGACRHDAAPRGPIDLVTVERLRAGDVSRLALQKTDSVVLGTADETVGEINDLKVSGGRIYVLDAMAKRVRVFDRAGRLVRTIGREGSGPGEFRDPTALAFAPGELLVADLHSGVHAAFAPVRGGFVSVYTRYSEADDEVRASLFVCRDGRRPRCGTVENIGRPVYIPSLDTVYIQEELQPDQPVQIGIYRITGLPR